MAAGTAKTIEKGQPVEFQSDFPIKRVSYFAGFL